MEKGKCFRKQLFVSHEHNLLYFGNLIVLIIIKMALQSIFANLISEDASNECLKAFYYYLFIFVKRHFIIYLYQYFYFLLYK